MSGGAVAGGVDSSCAARLFPLTAAGSGQEVCALSDGGDEEEKEGDEEGS